MSLMIECGFAVPVDKQSDGEKKGKADIRFDWKCDITPHMFRHNFATRLYEAGIDPLVASKILGHADYSTTAKIYTHLDKSYIGAAATKLNEKAKSGKVAGKLPDMQKDQKISYSLAKKKPLKM